MRDVDVISTRLGINQVFGWSIVRTKRGPPVVCHFHSMRDSSACCFPIFFFCFSFHHTHVSTKFHEVRFCKTKNKNLTRSCFFVLHLCVCERWKSAALEQTTDAVDAVSCFPESNCTKPPNQIFAKEQNYLNFNKKLRIERNKRRKYQLRAYLESFLQLRHLHSSAADGVLPPKAALDSWWKVVMETRKQEEHSSRVH